MNTRDQPLFSIIIPVYQCEKTLERSIKSVLSQNEDCYEIVLVDDGSTDDSGHIADYYMNMFPHKIKTIHKSNEGPLLARLDGITISTGQYLMFLDADDTYQPEILHQIKSAIERYQADMVIFNYYRSFIDGSLHLSQPQYSNDHVFEGTDLKQLYKDMITGVDLNCVWQKCVSRKLLINIEELRQYEKIVIGEDKLLSLEMVRNAKRVVYIADGLYKYYISSQSLSHNLTLKHYQDMAIVHIQTLQYASYMGCEDYKDLCYKNKIEFGMSCLYSIAEKVLLHKKKLKDFVNLAQYTVGDKEYWKAYDCCKKIITIHKRIVCFLLKYKMIYLTFIYFYIGIFIKRIINDVSVGDNECELNE